MRLLAVSAALVCALVLTGPAGAQKSERPTELWAEYPLVQKVEPAQPTTIGPLLPPAQPEPTPVSGEPTDWSMWLVVLALAAISALLALRAVQWAPTAAPVLRGLTKRRPRPRAPSPLQLREHPRAPTGGRRAQYAPLPPVAVPEPDVEREARRYVVRRSGLLRSRFVVVADEPGGKMSRLASSRSFSRLGDAARRERVAEDAWTDLVNDLRVSGWEPTLTGRSDFYVLLKPVESRPSSILPTIEAYTHNSDPAAKA